MYYNITTYGKNRTTTYYGDYNKVRAYLLKKKKEGFITLRDVNGKQSEFAISMYPNHMNVCIQHKDA